MTSFQFPSVLSPLQLNGPLKTFTISLLLGREWSIAAPDYINFGRTTCHTVQSERGIYHGQRAMNLDVFPVIYMTFKTSGRKF
uniref:Sulfate transporter 1.2-like n=1 Tax=Rhizophora mucronata TaxID=61149 RepID=A0A2P2LGM4_RHIMU